MKKIAVIQDMSGLGKCSLTAAIPVISAMGVQACPLPTAILSNQTGYDSYFCDDYTSNMDAIIDEWEKRKFSPDGIYTGFLMNTEQIDKILKLIRMFQKAHTKIIVDPVMGDNGSVYKTYNEALCKKMRALTEAADVITPNLTEALILLYGEKKMKAYFSMPVTKERAEQWGRELRELFHLQHVIITGIHDKKDNQKIVNLIVSENHTEWIASEKYGGSYSGTGDLFASVVSAGIVKGERVEDTVKKAVRFLEPAIRDTVEEGTDCNDGICFEKYLHYLWEESR